MRIARLARNTAVAAAAVTAIGLFSASPAGAMNSVRVYYGSPHLGWTLLHEWSCTPAIHYSLSPINLVVNGCGTRVWVHAYNNITSPLCVSPYSHAYPSFS